MLPIIVGLFVFLCFLFILILLLIAQKPKGGKDEKPTQSKPKAKKPTAPRVTPEYDREGYNRYGYNSRGKNRQGKYDRYYDVESYKTSDYSPDGFLDIRMYPLFLTDHAIERMSERMGIKNYSEMESRAIDAYRFGKSKLQLMKSQRAIIEEKERQHEDGVILLYRGYVYVFTEDNGLITVYKDDGIRK